MHKEAIAPVKYEYEFTIKVKGIGYDKGEAWQEAYEGLTEGIPEPAQVYTGYPIYDSPEHKRLYEAEHDRRWKNYIRAVDEMEKIIDAAISSDVFVDYSAWKRGEDDNPINNLQEVAIDTDGKNMIIEQIADFGSDYMSPLLRNPTWLDLCIMANEMIQTTGDYHHIYLEGITTTKRKTEEGSIIVEFNMGS